MHNCINCNKETKNPKFCSRSCSVSKNNRVQPKRVGKVRSCKHCQKPGIGRRVFCDDCKGKENSYTIEQLSYEKCLPQQALNYIRYLSRQKGMKLFSSCINCDYSKHIEIAHIKAITSFPKTTLISEVNHESNLLPLCTNCHWEFDHDEQFKTQLLTSSKLRCCPA